MSVGLNPAYSLEEVDTKHIHAIHLAKLEDMDDVSGTPFSSNNFIHRVQLLQLPSCMSALPRLPSGASVLFVSRSICSVGHI